MAIDHTILMCFKCGTITNLHMLPIQMKGAGTACYLIVCGDCTQHLVGKTVLVELVDTPEIERTDN